MKLHRNSVYGIEIGHDVNMSFKTVSFDFNLQIEPKT